MAIFGSNNNYDDLDTLVCEGYDAEVNGSVDAIIESYDDQLAIMEAIHKMDMEELEMKKEGKDDEEIGELIEASMADTWKKIKEFFVNLFAKIRAWIDSAILYFESHVKSTEKFLDKYEKQIKELKLEGYKAKMFKYQNLDKISDTISKRASATLAELDKDNETIINNAKEGKTDENVKFDENALNAVRGAMVEINGDVEAAKYSDALYKYFRGVDRKEEPKEQPVDITAIIKDLRTAAGLVKSFKDCKKEQEVIEKKTLARLKNAEAEALREVKGDKAAADRITAAVNKTARHTQSMTAIYVAYINAAKTVCNEIISTYTKVCRGAFSYKKESK